MAADLGEHEVSRRPELTLEAAIEAGDVPVPELMRFQGWLAWRGGDGQRPARRKGDLGRDLVGTNGKFEANLWRATMERIYGDDWKAQLDAKELAELAASLEEEEEEEEEELVPENPVAVAAPKTAAVPRASSPAADRMSSSAGVVARLKATLENPFVPTVEDFAIYSARVQRIGEALGQLGGPIPEGEMEMMLFRAEVSGKLEGYLF